jgi:CheY-like chemotaxis protein
MFVVELPYVVPPQLEPPHVEPPHVEPLHVEPHVEPPHVEPPREVVPVTPVATAKRLLIIDDELTIRNAVARFFRSLGHKVDVAATGREGIELVLGAAYDALLLDLRLPDLTGDEVLRELEAAGRMPKRVVFVTGDTQSGATRRVLEATGRPIVAKPFLFDELATVVLAEAER